MSTRPLFDRIDRLATPVAQIITRLVFGQSFALTGWGKLHNLEGVTKFFTELGIPAPEIQAPMIATLEFVGGILLLFGLGTRVAALLLTGTMVVALATAHGGDLAESFRLDEVFANVAPLPYLVALLWLLAKGAGALSLDHWIGKRGGRKTAA
ncbi:MAG: DoxX family protein [Planctomycetes bacterium]|nr:DoxX family protein [Planctomycetota bacterium]